MGLNGNKILRMIFFSQISQNFPTRKDFMIYSIAGAGEIMKSNYLRGHIIPGIAGALSTRLE